MVTSRVMFLLGTWKIYIFMFSIHDGISREKIIAKLLCWPWQILCGILPALLPLSIFAFSQLQSFSATQNLPCEHCTNFVINFHDFLEKPFFFLVFLVKHPNVLYFFYDLDKHLSVKVAVGPFLFVYKL